VVENYDKCLAIFEAMVAANPGNALMQRDLGAGYGFYGESWKNLAQQPGIANTQRRTSWLNARQWIVRSLKNLEQMQTQGQLPGQDNRAQENMRKLISECDAALAKLR
jgi:hypothetical protein